jgi:hypothetical protein
MGMLHNKRAEAQCSYGCCRTLRRKGNQTHNGLLRRRENRAWRAEI